MEKEQITRIIEVVEQTTAGMFTKSELIAKLEAITGEKFEDDVDLPAYSTGTHAA